MIWDILRDKIVDAGIAVTGETLFLSEFPPDVKIGVMMREPLDGVKVDPHLPCYHKPNLQMIVRHINPVAGAAMAMAVSDVLTINQVENYPATAERGKVQLNVFYPRTLPIRFPRLESDLIEWSINFTTSFTLASQ